jgi:hypothetical protein
VFAIDAHGELHDINAVQGAGALGNQLNPSVLPRCPPSAAAPVCSSVPGVVMGADDSPRIGTSSPS